MVAEPSEEPGLVQGLSLCPGLGLAVLALGFPTCPVGTPVLRKGSGEKIPLA